MLCLTGSFSKRGSAVVLSLLLSASLSNSLLKIDCAVKKKSLLGYFALRSDKRLDSDAHSHAFVANIGLEPPEPWQHL